jgi:hypothetical protein
VWRVAGHRSASPRGILFVVLATCMLGLAYQAIKAGVWVVALAGVVLGGWMLDLASYDLGLRHRS